MLKLAKAHKLQGRLDFQGLDVSVENAKGSTRRWYDPNGKEAGSTLMHYTYGYIRRTRGTDGDHVDVYIGPSTDSERVFIVNQMKKPPGAIVKDGKAWTQFDEQKCMLGFRTPEEAKAAYLKQYDDPRFFGSMKEMTMSVFRDKVLAKENHGKKIASAPLGTEKLSGDVLKFPVDPKRAKAGVKKIIEKVIRGSEKGTAGLAASGIVTSPLLFTQATKREKEEAAAKRGKAKPRGPLRTAAEVVTPAVPLALAGAGAGRSHGVLKAHRLAKTITGAKANIRRGTLAGLGIGAGTGLALGGVGEYLHRKRVKRLSDAKKKSTEKKADYAPEQAVPAAFMNAVVGQAIGTLSGGATGKLLGKYPGQSREYGGRAAMLTGATQGIVTGQNKLINAVRDIATSKSQGAAGIAEAVGRTVMRYSPEIAAGAIGAAVFARKEEPVKGKAKTSQLAHANDTGEGLPKAEIAKGVKVEMEHTTHPATARQIAIDHLRESPEYYVALKKMEDKLESDKEAARASWADAIVHGAGEALERSGKGAPYSLALKRHAAKTMESRATAMGTPVGELAAAVAQGVEAKGMHRTSHPKVREALRESIKEIRGMRKTNAAVFERAKKAAARLAEINLMHGTLSTAEEAGIKLPPPGIKEEAGARALGGSPGVDDLSMTAFARDVSGSDKVARARGKVAGLEDRVDDVGIGMLAAPYAAELAGGAMSHVPGRVGSWGKALKSGLGMNSRFAHGTLGHARELAGLALVAPGVTHGVAKTIRKVAPKSEEKAAALEKVAAHYIPDFEYRTEAEKRAILCSLEKMAVNWAGLAGGLERNLGEAVGAAKGLVKRTAGGLERNLGEAVGKVKAVAKPVGGGPYRTAATGIPTAAMAGAPAVTTAAGSAAAKETAKRTGGLLGAGNVAKAGLIGAGGLTLYGGYKGVQTAGNVLSHQPQQGINIPSVEGPGASAGPMY